MPKKHRDYSSFQKLFPTYRPPFLKGKRRASQNALRHGLASRIKDEISPRVEAFARAIVGDDADILLLQTAIDFAEASLDLARIRQIRGFVFLKLSRGATNIDHPDGYFLLSPTDQRVLLNCYIGGHNDEFGHPPKGEKRIRAMLERHALRDQPRPLCPLRELKRLQRYERSAAARRRSAMKALLVPASLLPRESNPSPILGESTNF